MSIPVILVIEDNLADVFLLRSCLDQLGEEYRLELLADGEAALGFIREHRNGTRKPEPCVILLDLCLPKHNGTEVLAAIKQEPVLEHVHVMVLTSMGRPEQRAEIEQLGAVYRTKPSKLKECQELAAEIMALCKGPLSAVAG